MLHPILMTRLTNLSVYVGVFALGVFTALAINFVSAQVEGVDVDPTGAPIDMSIVPFDLDSRFTKVYGSGFYGTDVERSNMTVLYGRLDYMVKQLDDLIVSCSVK